MHFRVLSLCLLPIVACHGGPKKGPPPAPQDVVLLLNADFKAPGGAEFERRLAPELELVRRSGGSYLGKAHDGRAVVRVPRQVLHDADLAAVSQVVDQPDSNKFDRIRELIVFLPDKDAFATLNTGSMKVARTLSRGRGVVVRSRDGIAGKDLEALLSHPKVRYIEPNYVFRLQGTGGPPNDVNYPLQWGLSNIAVKNGWKHSTDSGDMIIAVIDCGIQFDHPDLAANLWTNDDPINELDDDKNGYIDDLHGWSVFEADENQPAATKLHHGMHVAGIIGAVGNNKIGVSGVLWKTKIMVVKIFVPDPLDPREALSAPSDRIANGIDYAVANGAKIINLSWGAAGGPSEFIAEAVGRAGDADRLVVIAAGNDTLDLDLHEFFPASIVAPHVMKVINLGAANTISPWSNWGETKACIAAPGDWIESTILHDQWNYMSGTSMAAPHVAAAAALVWSIPKHSGKSAAEMRKLLIENARPLSALEKLCEAKGTLDLGFLDEEMRDDPVGMASEER